MNEFRKYTLLFVMLFAGVLCLSAQQSSMGFDKRKLSLGGNFGLNFGSYTAITVSPQVGYSVSKYATLGTGIGFSYFKRDYGFYDYKSTYLSYNVFGRVYPIQSLVLNFQPEINRMWQTVREDNGNKTTDERFFPTFLVGGGVRYAGVIAMLQYDLVQNKNSQYGNRIFYSFGYSFNF